MDVSENSGTPKSSILIGFSIINHPFWGTPILETPKYLLWSCNNLDVTGCAHTYGIDHPGETSSNQTFKSVEGFHAPKEQFNWRVIYQAYVGIYRTGHSSIQKITTKGSFLIVPSSILWVSNTCTNQISFIFSHVFATVFSVNLWKKNTSQCHGPDHDRPCIWGIYTYMFLKNMLSM